MVGLDQRELSNMFLFHIFIVSFEWIFVRSTQSICVNEVFSEDSWKNTFFIFSEFGKDADR